MENFAKIKKYVITHNISKETITDLADKLDTSISSITRFCKKEGFDGFKEMKFFYSSKNDFLDKASNIAFSIGRTRNSISYGSLKHFAKTIYEKDKVYIMGEGFTKDLAITFNRKLRKININSHVVDMGSDEGNVIAENNALYIFVSNSGRNRNIRITANKLISGIQDRKKISIISVVSNGYSNIEDIANETFMGYSLINNEDLERQVPSTNQIVNQFILDEMYSWVFNHRKEQNENLLDMSTYNKE